MRDTNEEKLYYYIFFNYLKTADVCDFQNFDVVNIL